MEQGSLTTVSEDETLIMEVKKHELGILWIWLIAGIVVLVLIVMLSVLGNAADSLTEGDGPNWAGVMLGVGGLLMVLVALFAFVSTWIYRANKFMLTTENLIQHIQHGIFSRKISQLNIGNVQDVTVQQTNPIARIFNYGTLIVETAGEQQNYRFTHTPNPSMVANAIMEAHETYIERVDQDRTVK